MTKYAYKTAMVLFTALLFVSCEKIEGEGGTSTICGTIIEEVYNDDFSVMVETAPVQDYDVFIIYGDGEAVGDKVETSPTGYFEFPYLHEGTYQVYYFSKDKQNPQDDKKEVLLEVSVGRGEKKDLGTFNTYSSADFDDGKASIKGTVYEINYSKNSLWPNMIAIDTVLAVEQAVYLQYGDHLYYDERIRTIGDGTFCFPNLIPGTYKVFVYSDDLKGSSQMQTILQTITISSNTATTHTLPDFYIGDF